MSEPYVPKSQRGKLPTVPAAEHLASEEDAALAMFNLLETDDPKHAFLLYAALYAAKGIPDITDKRVWIQEFAASLNRKALLSNNNVQPFREYGYQYMRGFP